MKDFAVDVAMFSVSEMRRSLFHPLATLRHRIWAGPETKETEQNEKPQCELWMMETAYTQWTQKLTSAVGTHAVFCNTSSFNYNVVSCTHTERTRWPWEVESLLRTKWRVTRDTRTECPRWPCEVLLRTEWRVRRDTRTRALIVRVGLVKSCFVQNEELSVIHTHTYTDCPRWPCDVRLWTEWRVCLSLAGDEPLVRRDGRVTTLALEQSAGSGLAESLAWCSTSRVDGSLTGALVARVLLCRLAGR
jgi:hypothetical protein